MDSFPAAGGGNTRGICYSSGGYLWQNQPLSSPYLMYQTNSSNGSVYSSFSLPGQYYTGAAPLATGDGGEGTTRIIVSNYDTKTIAYLTTAGSVVHSHATSQGLFEIAFDWRNRLIWGGTDSAAVNGYDTNGSLIASFKSPTTGNVHGITYHGEYLWVAGVTGLIYQIHCPACVGVKPASMGKLKAMFR